MRSLIRTQDSTRVAVESPARPTRGKWLYLVLLTLETIGAVLLAWQVLPIYREALANPTGYSFDGTAVGAGVLIQLAYWSCYQLRPSTPHFVNVPLGHIVLFAAKLIFLLPTSIFSFLFIANKFKVQLSIFRYLIIVFGLFSLFCYIRELEHLGNSLLGKRDDFR